MWTIRGTYGPDALARRGSALSAHESYLVEHSRQIRFAGPMFADDGETRSGTWFMIDAAERAAAEAFIAGEAFNRAGMFGDVVIKRFVDTSTERRRQVDIASDPTLQMFICEFVDGAHTALVRRTAGAAHNKYLEQSAKHIVVCGFSVTDDGSRLIGALAIVVAANRTTADAFVAADPMVQARAYADVRTDRWRFGRSVV